jgi:hypothetical protein
MESKSSRTNGHEEQRLVRIVCFAAANRLDLQKEIHAAACHPTLFGMRTLFF